MNRVTGADIFYIIVIVAVALGGTGFLWYYSAGVSQMPAASSAAGPRPIVLGTSINRGQVVDATQYLLPSQVDALFLHYCHQSATLDELDQWSGSSMSALESHLRSIQGQIICR